MRRSLALSVLVLLAGAAPPAGASVTNPRGQNFEVTAGQGYDGPVAVFFSEGKEPDNSAYTASIDWGDGSAPTPGSINPECGFCNRDLTVRGSHTYDGAGTFTVRVTVSYYDDPPVVAEAVARVTSGAPPAVAPPTARITAANATPRAGQKVVLSAAGSTGQGIRYAWDTNGDGSFELSTGPVAQAAVQFGESGLHEVTVLAIDELGRTAEAATEVTASPGPAHTGLQPTLAIAEPPGEPPCVLGVAVGLAEAVSPTCLTVKSGPTGVITEVTGTELQLNGITIAGGPIRIRPLQRAIESEDAVEMSVDGSAVGLGRVVVRNEPLALALPKRDDGARVVMAAGFEGQQVGSLGPFPLTGVASLQLVREDGRTFAQLDVTPALPPPFSAYASEMQITGSVTLRTDTASRLQIDGLAVDFGSTSFGYLPVRDLRFDYDGLSGWAGSGKIGLPGLASLAAQFTMSPSGALTVGGSYTFPPPGLPVDILSITKLNEIGFDVSPGRPFFLSGNARVTALGEIAGLSILGVDGCFLYVNATVGDAVNDVCGLTRSFNGTTNLFRLAGTADVLTIPMGNASFELEGLNDIRLSASTGFSCCDVPLLGYVPVGSISSDVSGRVNLAFRDFYVTGEGNVCALDVACLDGGVVVSSVGVSGCAGGVAQIGWVYGDWPYLKLGGCNWDAFYPVSIKLQGRRQGPAVTTFEVAEGTPTFNLRVEGAGGAPRLRLRGPGGETIETPAAGAKRYVKSGDLAAYHLPESPHSSFLVERPAPGRWTLEPLPGSASVKGVEMSELAPEPRIRARVTGRGARRVLRYRIAGVAPAKVTFADATKRIGRARRARGRLPFRVSAGRGGTRRIDARIAGGELPRVVRVAGFRVARPARPGPIRARRRVTTLTLRWRRVRGARRYLLAARLGDGRTVLAQPRRPRTRITLLRRHGARVRIVAELPDGSRTRPRTVRVRGR